MMTRSDSDHMTPDDFQNRTGVNDKNLDRLKIYAEVLRKWQRRINLVSNSTLDDLWCRHMLDSAQIVDHLKPNDKTILDLGSGAGFPGMVIAILTPASVHLVESNSRKCTFLREVARETDTKITIHDSRIESLKPFPVDIVTARALAPVGELIAYSAPFLAENGHCLFLKGQKKDQELTDSRKKWNMIVTETKSLSDSSGVLLNIEGISRRHDSASD